MKSVRTLVLLVFIAGCAGQDVPAGVTARHRPPALADFVKPTEAELQKTLTPIQFAVTQKDDTEPPFQNAYWNNHEAGIYVDVVSGEPLFSSTDKFDSDSGWPSFNRPLESGNVVEQQPDTAGPIEAREGSGESHPVQRANEVRSRHSDSHLGHVFDDGPPPTGLRYCINSAAIRFIPVSELEKAGYGNYRALFR